MRRSQHLLRSTAIALAASLLASGCATSTSTSPRIERATLPLPTARTAPSSQAQEVVLFALGLIDTGYQFGGKNPDAGLDCSGMVAYIFAQAAGLRLSGSAAEIAQRGRPVGLAALQSGDLVFFNTRGRRHSHVGIYIGDGRFVHAPSSNGRVRLDRLDAAYYGNRFDEARRYFESPA